jgi:hypothetical protein
MSLRELMAACMPIFARDMLKLAGLIRSGQCRMFASLFIVEFKLILLPVSMVWCLEFPGWFDQEPNPEVLCVRLRRRDGC